jgi:hypothetical protein
LPVRFRAIRSSPVLFASAALRCPYAGRADGKSSDLPGRCRNRRVLRYYRKPWPRRLDSLAPVKAQYRSLNGGIWAVIPQRPAKAIRLTNIGLSSTSNLIDERAEAIHAVLASNCVPVSMENWAATSDRPQDLIVEKLATCAFFVLLVGYRRGEIADGQSNHTWKWSTRRRRS